MSVEELSDLQVRHVDLSDRFKAAWTFHQFLHGVNKVFASRGIGGPMVAFQGIYTELKTVSKNLHNTTSGSVRSQLNTISDELEQRVSELLEADDRIDPSLMRQFFDRVKHYDTRILVQLLKFYLFTRSGDGWENDRLDKADFLLTHLGHTLIGPNEAAIERGPLLLKDSLDELWRAVGSGPPSDGTVDDAVREIRTLREAIEQIQSIEQFNHLGLVQGHRRLKHSLGDYLFYPKLAGEIIANNLLLRRRIKEFYEKEEVRISADCQEVFELERGASAVNAALDTDLENFRGEVDEFEKKVATRNVKLDELTHIGARARTLIPRLRKAGNRHVDDTTGEVSAIGPGEWGDGLPAEKPSFTLRIRTAHADVVGESLRQLLEFLENSDWQAGPRAVTQSPDALPLRLDPREVVAYRRLYFSEQFDVELEKSLLEAVALRLRIAAEAEEIVGMIDLLGTQRDADVFNRARESLRLANAFEMKFSYFIEQALLAEDPMEARTLQLNRMRLVRQYSGLWLLVYG